MDMWGPFIKVVKKFCPNADIVFDLFHIVSQFNKVIDKVRKIRDFGSSPKQLV